MKGINFPFTEHRVGTNVCWKINKSHSHLTRQYHFGNTFFKPTFYFRTVLDIQSSYENSTESSHIPHTQFPLVLINVLY